MEGREIIFWNIKLRHNSGLHAKIRKISQQRSSNCGNRAKFGVNKGANEKWESITLKPPKVAIQTPTHPITNTLHGPNGKKLYSQDSKLLRSLSIWYKDLESTFGQVYCTVVGVYINTVKTTCLNIFPIYHYSYLKYIFIQFPMRTRGVIFVTKGGINGEDYIFYFISKCRGSLYWYMCRAP